MNLQHAPGQATVSRERHHEADTHLHGRRLLLARIVWFALVAFTLSVYMTSLPEYWTKLQTVCRLAVCSYGQLSSDTVVALEHFGLSLGSYTAFMVALATLLALVCFAASGVIFWRKSDDGTALLHALGLVGVGMIPVLLTLGTSHLAKPLPIQGVWELLLLVFFAFTLFPDGRFVPSFTRWLFVVYSIDTVVFIFFTNPFTGFFTVPHWLGVAVVLLLLSLFVGQVIAQIYRYRYVSTLVQRQQTKWVLYGFTANTVWFVAGFLPTLIFPRSLFTLVFTLVYYCTLFPYPLTVSFAILRYRLWDIDILINRTLVYGMLTVLLSLLYFGLVIGLQALVRLFTGQVSQSPVIIVASTLAIAALSQPLRHRIQRIIDRRFYRSKYDAARILAHFSATLRNEVDLNQLREQLVAVVQETMQPTFVSLWLRPPEHDGTQEAPWRATPPGSSEEG